MSETSRKTRIKTPTIQQHAGSALNYPHCLAGRALDAPAAAGLSLGGR